MRSIGRRIITFLEAGPCVDQYPGLISKAIQQYKPSILVEQASRSSYPRSNFNAFMAVACIINMTNRHRYIQSTSIGVARNFSSGTHKARRTKIRGQTPRERDS